MWHFRQSNNLLKICVLILSAGFMLQLKVLYNNHQKQLRVQEVEERMIELANSIHSVEGVANTTSILISKLQKTLKFRSHRSKVKKRR